MICPYYNNGYCTSPRLGKPLSSVTSSLRCRKNYVTCSYYVPRGDTEKEEEKHGLTRYITTEDKRINFYTQINLIDPDMISNCEYFTPIRTEKGLVARCEAMDRLLARHQALLCVKEYPTCPFRQFYKNRVG